MGWVAIGCTNSQLSLLITVLQRRYSSIPEEPHELLYFSPCSQTFFLIWLKTKEIYCLTVLELRSKVKVLIGPGSLRRLQGTSLASSGFCPHVPWPRVPGIPGASAPWSPGRLPPASLCVREGLQSRVFPAVQWLRIRLAVQGTRVPLLAGELRSHRPGSH